MILQIADFYFDVDETYPRIVQRCREYICEAAPRIDASFSLTASDVQKEYEIEKQEPGFCSRPQILAWNSLYRRICAYALAHDAFLMHCAVIEYEGRGYAFSAPSGTGKTTHIRLWQQVFGEDKVTIVNGDKPILRVLDGKIYAYGTPWCGKEWYNTNTRVPLTGLSFVKRGAENQICRLSAEQAVPRLFGQIMVSDSPDLARQMELADILLQKVPCYLLTCNMEPDAARIAYRGMSGGFLGQEDVHENI